MKRLPGYFRIQLMWNELFYFRGDFSMSFSSLKTRNFDLDKAVLLATASELAYEDDWRIISEWSNRVGFIKTQLFDRGNIQGFWATSPEVSLLVFRGTDNLGQWIRDFKVLPVRHQWGKVHSGFMSGLAEVKQEIAAFTEEATKSPFVWLTGHSLGGALAVLASAHLKMAGISSCVYTYGQPRMCLNKFSKQFSARLPGALVRFINQKDIIPRLPPGLIYYHIPICKRIVRPGQMESAGAEQGPPFLEESELPPITEEENQALLDFLEQHPALTNDSLEGRMPLFSDHAMKNYTRMLIQLRDQGDQSP